jgi:hypothetical protein
MSAQTSWLLIGTGAAMTVAGLAMLWCSSARARQHRARSARPARPARPRAGLAGALTCTSVVCGLITGMQWAVLSQTGPGEAWAVVLSLPAFLAGATVARLLAVLRSVHGRRRQARAGRRGRGCRR